MEPEVAPQIRWSIKSSSTAEADSVSQPDSQGQASKASQVQPQLSSEGPGPVSWHPAVQLSVPGVISDSSDPQKLSSVASPSTVVNDLGNAQYLEDSQSFSDASPTSSRVSTAQLVAQTGSRFIDATDPPQISESDGHSQVQATPQDRVKPANLGNSIRAALSPAKDNKEFLPIDALDRLVTKNQVRLELSRLEKFPSTTINSLTNDVWDSHSVFLGKKTTRKKIFAILALLEKFEEIDHFIQEGLHDNDLPFIISKDACSGSPRLHRKGDVDKLHPIQLFDTWSSYQIEYFSNCQWQLIAPYFRLSTETDRKVHHINIEEHGIILPFIEDDEGKRSAGEGGYGDVWRVKIHPAHHNCCENSAPPEDNPSYAVKRLRYNDYEAFRDEVSNLKRFSEKDHLHLIKLLATYKYRDKFHLIFPWADGNLLDFWKLYPQPSHPKRDRDMAVWFSGQCLGIVQGLKMIHTADRPSRDDTSGHPIHGRHGDLKPENILWFKAHQDIDQTYFGQLKISDFGLTRYHRTRSKSHFEQVAVSPTYRPPEYEVATMVSPSYDIWSLGCVLLEFAGWYLLGWEEVERFSKLRTTDDGRDIPEDVFFKFVDIQDDNGTIQQGARAKVSVADEFQYLSNNRNCYDFLLDLLTFVEDRVLRMDPKHRADCSEILEKFTELHNTCLEDHDYCTKRLKVAPTRSETALSELSASTLRLPREIHGQINRTAISKHTDPHHNHPQLTAAPRTQSPAADPHHSRLNNPIVPEPLQPGSSGDVPDRTSIAPEDQIPKAAALEALPYANGTVTPPSEPSYYEAQSSRLQSSPKKVRFEGEEQQLPEWGGSEPEEEVGAVRGQLVDTPDRKDEQDVGNQRHNIQLNPGPNRTVDLDFDHRPSLSRNSSTQTGSEHREPPSDSAEGPELKPVAKPESPIHTDHLAADEGMDNTSLGNDSAHDSPLPAIHHSSFQNSNSHEDIGNDVRNPSKNTDGQLNGNDSHPASVPATFKRDQPQGQNEPEKPGSHMDGSSEDTTTLKRCLRGVKRFMSHLFCFTNSR